MNTFTRGDRVRVRLPNGGERLADVVRPTDDPNRYMLALNNDTQIRRIHVRHMTLVRSIAQVRAAQRAPRRQTMPPIVLFAIAGAAALVLIALDALLAQH